MKSLATYTYSQYGASALIYENDVLVCIAYRRNEFWWITTSPRLNHFSKTNRFGCWYSITGRTLDELMHNILHDEEVYA